MKKLLAVTAAAVCSLATPLAAQALPTYASIIAKNHCEYLRAGFSWDDAISQALSDNRHWLDEIKADGDRAPRVIQLAIHKACYDLNSRARGNR